MQGEISIGDIPQATSDETLTCGLTGGGEATLTAGADGVDGCGELADKVEWDVGDVIDGRYEIISELGRGGMGRVVKARHLQWQREMAVKMPHAHLVADAAARERFVREAQTWVNLGLHPNIVQCWYVRELGGVPRLFLDFVDGGSLKEAIRQGRIATDDWAGILDVAIQACDGLGYAHEQGVVHRDVKPANLLLTSDGRVCVTDFGLVKLAGLEDVKGDDQTEAPCDCGLTMTGSEVGTPEYGAPEQWGEARHADARADVYAMGMTLFELCTGRRPFDDGSHNDPAHVLIGRHLTSPVPDPRSFNAEIPDDLAEVILQCLAKAPDKRPQSAQVLREGLVAIHERIRGTSYPRHVPEAAEIRAPALNNQAISLWDLGKIPEAIEALEAALKADPMHLLANRNLGLMRWELGRESDEQFLDRLRRLEAQEGKRGDYWRFLAELQLARGDAEAAGTLQERAREASDADARAMQALSDGMAKASQVSWQRIGKPQIDRSFQCGDLSDDGHWAVTGTDDWAVQVWDAENARHWDSISTTPRTPLFVRFRPRSTHVLVLTGETALIYDIAQGVPIVREELRGNRAAWFPDGKRIVLGIDRSRGTGAATSPRGGQERLELRSGSTLKLIAELPDSDWTTALAVSDDGRTVVSGGNKDGVRIIAVESGRIVRRLKGHSGSVSALAASQGLVATGSTDATLRVWRLADGACLRIFEGHDATISQIRLWPEKGLLLSGSRTGELRLWRLGSGTCLRTLPGHDDRIVGLGLSTACERAMSAGDDRRLFVWQIPPPTYRLHPEPALASALGEQQQVQQEVREHLERARTSLEEANVSEARDAVSRIRSTPGYERDRRAMVLWHRIASASVRHGVGATWLLAEFAGHAQSVTALTLDRTGQRLITGGDEAELRLWDVDGASCTSSFKGTDSWITGLAFSATGDAVLSSHYDGAIRRWNPSTGDMEERWMAHEGPVTALAGSAGHSAVLSSGDSMVKSWRGDSGELLAELPGHAAKVTAVALSADGTVGVSGSVDRTVRLWQLPSGKRTRVLGGHGKAVRAVAIHPDCELCASADDTGEIRLWRMNNGTCTATLCGHDGPVRTLAFVPDGRHLASGSNDGTIGIWSIPDGDLAHRISGLDSWINAAAFTPDCARLAVALWNGRVLLWEMDWLLSDPPAAPSSDNGGLFGAVRKLLGRKS